LNPLSKAADLPLERRLGRRGRRGVVYATSLDAFSSLQLGISLAKLVIRQR